MAAQNADSRTVGRVPARKAAAARIRAAEAAAQAAETARDAALLKLRSPAPGQAAYLTNQVINALDARSMPPGANWTRRTRPRRPSRPGSRSARCLRTWSAWTPRSSRSPTPSGWPPITPKPRWPGDEAYAVIREALAVSGDIQPGPGELLIRLDPLTAPRRTQALAALCDQLTAASARYPGTNLVLRYEVKSHPGPA